MLRSFPPRVGDASPWGRVDTVSPLGPDVVQVTTASHGGLWVSTAAMARMPDPLRATAYSAEGYHPQHRALLGLDAGGRGRG